MSGRLLIGLFALFLSVFLASIIITIIAKVAVIPVKKGKKTTAKYEDKVEREMKRINEEFDKIRELNDLDFMQTGRAIIEAAAFECAKNKGQYAADKKKRAKARFPEAVDAEFEEC